MKIKNKRDVSNKNILLTSLSFFIFFIFLSTSVFAVVDFGYNILDPTITATSNVTDTNASTACTNAEVLLGNGTCFPISDLGSGTVVDIWINETIVDLVFERMKYIENNYDDVVDKIGLNLNINVNLVLETLDYFVNILKMV